MTTLQVDKLIFDFDPTIAAGIYDKWHHYSSVWNALPRQGQKAVDIVAVGGVPQITVWLIEAKDFRVITNPPKPSNIGGLPQLVEHKVRHTLAGLEHASLHATVREEKTLATDAVACIHRRIVLHLEPHTGAHTALFPKGFSAIVLQKLRQLVKAIDPNPLVLNIANTHLSSVPWSVG